MAANAGTVNCVWARSLELIRMVAIFSCDLIYSFVQKSVVMHFSLAKRWSKLGFSFLSDHVRTSPLLR